MIDRYTTDQFGPGGMGLSYYTGRNAEQDVFIEIPQEFDSGGIPPRFSLFATTFPMFGDSFSFIQSLYFINERLKEIYDSHHILTKDVVPANISARYNTGIQSTILFINQAITMCICRACFAEKNMNGNSMVMYSIGTLFEEHNKGIEFANNIFNKVFINSNDSDLAQTVEWLKGIYFSANMYTSGRVFGQDYPTVTAIEPYGRDDVSYVFHNHALRQIVLGLNDFFKNIELFHDPRQQ